MFNWFKSNILKLEEEEYAWGRCVVEKQLSLEAYIKELKERKNDPNYILDEMEVDRDQIRRTFKIGQELHRWHLQEIIERKGKTKSKEEIGIIDRIIFLIRRSIEILQKIHNITEAREKYLEKYLRRKIKCGNG